MASSIDAVLTNARAVYGDLRADGKGWILLAVSAGWFLSIGVRYVFPALLPFLRTEFQFDLTTAGLLLTLLWLAYALGQFPGGILGDRIGEGNILVISTAVSMVGVLVVTMSRELWLLFVGITAFGFASALYAPTRFSIMTEIYESRAGTAVGLSMAAGSIGNTLLPAFVGIMATYVSWRLGLGVLLPLFLGSLVALWLVVPSRTSSSGDGTADLSIETVRRVLDSVRRGGIPIVLAIQILGAFANQGVLGFFTIYLIDVKGFAPSIAASLYALYFAVGVVVQPLVGAGRDRFGAKWTLLWVLFFYFSGIFLFTMADSLLHFLIITALLSARNGTGVINNTFVSDSLDDDIKGTGLGLLRSTWILAAALSPVFVGFLGDRGYFGEAFLIMAGLMVIAIGLATMLPDEA